MDLLSSIRKEGSRGGVNFSWDDVKTSQHRENYLGHSILAPVGRWQKNRDLNWYAKGEVGEGVDGETAEERKARERKEEIRRVKEAEEDALNKALGLPAVDRGGTGVNSIAVTGDRVGLGDPAEVDQEIAKAIEGEERGGLIVKERKREGREEREDRKHRRHRHRSRSGERHRHRRRDGGEERRNRSRDRRRSRSPERPRRGKDGERDDMRHRERRDDDRGRRRPRSRSGDDDRRGR